MGSDIALALFAGLTLIFTALEIVNTIRLSKLDRDVHRLSVGLDQRVKRLERMGELIAKITALQVEVGHYEIFQEEVTQPQEQFIDRWLKNSRNLGEEAASLIELRGLCVAINDNEISKFLAENDEKVATRTKDNKVTMFSDIAIKLHTRIYQLIEAATTEQKTR